jgi:hypothetical protein
VIEVYCFIETGLGYLCEFSKVNADNGILNPYRACIAKDSKALDKGFVVTMIQSVQWGCKRVSWIIST